MRVAILAAAALLVASLGSASDAVHPGHHPRQQPHHEQRRASTRDSRSLARVRRQETASTSAAAAAEESGPLGTEVVNVQSAAQTTALIDDSGTSTSTTAAAVAAGTDTAAGTVTPAASSAAATTLVTTAVTSSIDLNPSHTSGITLPKVPVPLPTVAPTPVPTPMDTSIGSTVSTACYTYLLALLKDANFMACLPFSLLLSSSGAFKSQLTAATTTGNFTYLNSLIAYTTQPSPGGATCDQNYANYTSQIADKANCASDLTSVAVAKQARRGMGNYAVMRTAAGIVNPTSGSYCYLEAVASSNPADLYLWGLPAGNIALLMDHLGAWAANTTSLNGTILASAATTINAKCGANFIATVADSSSGSQSNAAGYAAATPSIPGLFIAILLVTNLFVWVHLL